MADEIKLTPEQLRALISTEKSFSLTGTQTSHGPMDAGTSTSQFGFLSNSGVRPGLYNVVPGVRGALAAFTLEGSVFYNEDWEHLTEIGDPTGNNATSFITAGPQAGAFKVATLRQRFGKFKLDSAEISIPDSGMRRDRADLDRRLLNGSAENYPLHPEAIFALDPNADLNRMYIAQMVAMGDRCRPRHQ